MTALDRSMSTTIGHSPSFSAASKKVHPDWNDRWRVTVHWVGEQVTYCPDVDAGAFISIPLFLECCRCYTRNSHKVRQRADCKGMEKEKGFTQPYVEKNMNEGNKIGKVWSESFGDVF